MMEEREEITVLLVEDNPGDARLIQEMFREVPEHKVALVICGSIESAVEELRRTAVDVMLLDLGLPDSQGLDSISNIRFHTNVPIVVLTGLDDDAVSRQIIQRGAQDYLIKGQVESGPLSRSVKYAVERYRMQLELEHAATELRKTEARLRTIIQKTRSGLIVVDYNGVVQFINPASEEILQCSASEMVGKRFDYAIMPGQSQEVEITHNGKFTIAEMSVVDIDWDGQPAYLASLRDITERRQAETLFKNLSQSASVGIYIIQGGLMRYVNPQICHILGLPEEELLNANPSSFVYGEDLPLFNEQAVNMLRKSDTQPYEFRVVSRNGEIRWLLETVASIQYNGKRATLGSCMDITEVKRLEKKMLEMVELTKLKDDILSTVSHELRTPLATIKGYSTMLIDYADRLTHKEKSEYLSSIDRSTDRLTQLVERLLDMSRLDAGLFKLNRTLCSLKDVVELAVKEISIKEMRHRITLQVKDELPNMMLDARRIREIIHNLVDNACKYSKNETEVQIVVQRIGTMAQVSVTDSGIGIASEELSLVFDRMYRIRQRLSEDPGGMGLGLSLCKALVEAHGGTIWMSSERGKGSICTFTLPIDPGIR